MKVNDVVRMERGPLALVVNKDNELSILWLDFALGQMFVKSIAKHKVTKTDMQASEFFFRMGVGYECKEVSDV